MSELANVMLIVINHANMYMLFMSMHKIDIKIDKTRTGQISVFR